MLMRQPLGAEPISRRPMCPLEQPSETHPVHHPFNSAESHALAATENAMRRLVLTSALLVLLSSPAFAGENELAGTYRLVVEQRQIVDTGEVVPVKNPQGYIMYGNDGRMIAIVVRAPRPKPESIEKTTDQERADLFRTMTAYAGTYKFDGTKVEHYIDLSWNEVWTGTTQVRSVKRDGERLVYTTPPFHFHTDGKLSVNMLIWEKVQ